MHAIDPVWEALIVNGAITAVMLGFIIFIPYWSDRK